jgi:23S rRNA pseudouridine1911/1915/1917 synthase
VAGTQSGAERRTLTVSAPGRIDAVIAAAYPDLTRARVQRLIEGGHARVNGLAVRKSAQVAEGDLVTVALPRTEHAKPVAPPGVTVLYEDDAIVAIDKPAGLAVHGAPGDTGPSVAAWFLARYPAEAALFDAERPGIVHRLDKGTSGVMLLAKTPSAQAALSAAFQERTTEKTYLALCEGVPKQPHAIVDAALARHPGDRTRMTVDHGGREAQTEYELLAERRERSLLRVHPTTGRTHQIRVHLAAIGLPVMGDRVYGRSGEGRHLLHAWRIAVPHPAGGTLTVTAPAPTDFLAAAAAAGLEEAARSYAENIPASRS